MDCHSHQCKWSHQVLVVDFLCHSTTHTEEEKHVETAHDALVTSMFLLPAVLAKL